MNGRPGSSDMHVIWTTAGLGCDGDTVAMTAATNPSIEDLVLGALPGVPRVHLHNPVLAYEVGIPPEKRDQIFQRFYQAHGGGHGGLGLGLYICRQIAELHGGDIRGEFPLDGDTRVIFRVPVQHQN